MSRNLRKMRITIFIASLVFILSGCLFDFNRYGGELTKPPEASIAIDSLVIDQFDKNNVDILRRYIAGNSRWEIRPERGKTYAIRKEKQDGKYRTTFDGFYGDFESISGIYQTRVIISFGQYLGRGIDEKYFTFATSKDKSVQMTIEGEHSGTPGNSSYLIIKGNAINIEIYEQAEDIKREFTSKTIKKLNTELTEVLKFQEEINQTGIMPLPEYYPTTYDSKFFNILDSDYRGGYIIQAGLAMDQEGVVYTKAFSVKNNVRLSADRMTPATTKEIGWSSDGKSIFLYEILLTVDEGEWDNQYMARFEIWFRDKDGKEKKLAEQTRLIKGAIAPWRI